MINILNDFLFDLCFYISGLNSSMDFCCTLCSFMLFEQLLLNSDLSPINLEPE
jgi:hypothetical protein